LRLRVVAALVGAGFPGLDLGVGFGVGFRVGPGHRLVASGVGPLGVGALGLRFGLLGLRLGLLGLRLGLLGLRLRLAIGPGLGPRVGRVVVLLRLLVTARRGVASLVGLVGVDDGLGGLGLLVGLAGDAPLLDVADGLLDVGRRLAAAQGAVERQSVGALEAIERRERIGLGLGLGAIEVAARLDAPADEHPE